MKRLERVRPFRRAQRGAAAVEFGVVGIVFLILLIGIVEMGRMLFTWNAAVEATRYGARVAVVCDLNDGGILARMQKIMPSLTASNISVSYLPGGCTTASCQQVRVSVSGLTITTHIPVVGGTFPVPPFATSLPRESLSSVMGGAVNPICI